MEKINLQLKAHQEQASDWQYHALGKELHRWVHIFNFEFKLEISQPVIAIDKLRSRTLAQYRRGRSGLGTRFSICLNATHLPGEHLYRILRWLLHELIHQWQEEHGKLCSPPYHNKQFRQKATECGLLTDARGADLGHTEVFSAVVAKHSAWPNIPVAEASENQVRKHGGSGSKLKKWSCGCTNVRCAVQLDATCNRCQKKFTLKGKEVNDMSERNLNSFAAKHSWKFTILPKTGLPVYLATRKGKWISKFTATPEDVFCPHFWVLGTSGGTCWFMCRECFLQGTYRAMRKPGVPVVYTNYDAMMRELTQWLADASVGKAVLTDGERGDSLLYDPDTGISQMLIPAFGRQKQKKFMRLTKSANVEHILELPHNGQIIVTFSVNAPEAQRVFESERTPLMEARYKAAILAQEAGYEIRFRYDPAIPIAGWKDAYRRTLEHLAALGARPTVITLGTPRRFPAVDVAIKYWHLEHMKLPVRLVGDGSDGRLRLPFDLRVEFLGSLTEMAREIFPSAQVGLCKETRVLRGKLGFTDADMTCNCTVI